MAITEPISAFAIDADISLKNDVGFARIILIDSSGKEYLAYETSSLLSDSNSFSVNEVCEETCYLDSITPASLRIEIENANIKINKISFNTKLEWKAQGMPEDKDKVKENAKENKKSQDDFKIQKMNENIKKKGMKWIAGETSVSKLTYAEKKILFPTSTGQLPDLKGFEYYKGGVFDDGTHAEELKGLVESGGISFDSQNENPCYIFDVINPPYDVPTAWDWRNVHGTNWMTSVENQGGLPVCWAYAATGATESIINLFNNAKLDVDLSESYIWCDYGAKAAPTETGLHALKNHAPVAEECQPSDACVRMGGNGCNTIWNINDYQLVSLNIGEIKQALIEHGPLVVNANSITHAMSLVGYCELKTTSINPIDIFIFKNSWGTDWGDSGYGYVYNPLSSLDIRASYYIKGISTTPLFYQQHCYDNDKDGFCNWGFGDYNPSICPPSCADNSIEDRDDSNPLCTSLSSSCNTIYASPMTISFLPPTPSPGDTIMDILNVSVIVKTAKPINNAEILLSNDLTQPLRSRYIKGNFKKLDLFPNSGASNFYREIEFIYSENGTWLYQVCAKDVSGLYDCSEERTVNVKTNPINVDTYLLNGIYPIYEYDKNFIIMHQEVAYDNSQISCKLYTKTPASDWIDRGTIQCANNFNYEQILISIGKNQYCDILGIDACSVKVVATSINGNSDSMTMNFNITPSKYPVCVVSPTYNGDSCGVGAVRGYRLMKSATDTTSSCYTLEQCNLVLNPPAPTPPPTQIATSPSPANSAIGVLTNGALSWISTNDATSYNVYLGLTNPPTTNDKVGSVIKTTTIASFNPGTLISSKKYYWRVDSVNAGGVKQGSVWSFTTAATPQVALVSPPTNSINFPSGSLLKWNPFTGATSYDLYLGITNPHNYKTNIATTSYTPTGLGYNAPYYWKIKAKNAAGAVLAESIAWKFTTKSA